MKSAKDLFGDKSFLFKFIVAILCLIVVLIWSLTTTGYGGTNAYIYYNTMLVASAGYLLIMLVFIIIYITDETEKLFEVLFLIVGAILNLFVGIVVLFCTVAYNGSWLGLVLGCCMIASGVLMILDVFGKLKN